MFRALPLVAVRQHQCDAVDAAPFDFARGDELVNDHLSPVDKITKLRFPDDQGVGVIGGVAILERQHSLFRKNGINHHERRLAVRHILQGGVGAFVKFLTILVVDHGMAVGKGAPATVFAAESHRITTGDQRGKGHVLAHAPVDRQVTPSHGGTIVIDLAHQLVRCDAGGQRRQALRQALPFGHRYRSVAGIGPLLAHVGRPVHRVFTFEIGQHRVDRVPTRIHGSPVSLDHVVTKFSA